MLTLDVNSNRGVFKLNLPTSLNEIDESYIMKVTNHVKVDSNYTLIGVVFREKLSTLILAARKNKKNSDIPVIPVFVKAGKTNSELINGLKVRDKLLISASDIMMGYHVSAPNNLLTINTILELIEEDITTYNKLIGSNEYCYFIEFKLVPNCNIHGAYEQSKVAEFVNPFVTKIADVPKSNIVVPNHNKVIV